MQEYVRRFAEGAEYAGAISWPAQLGSLASQPHSNRHFLFVTAPFGRFSPTLGETLRASGARCSRVLFNGGDAIDWGLRHAIVYRGRGAAWPHWLEAQIRTRHVTDIIVHGEGHPYGAAALDIARRLGLRCHIFEQGYFRPDWITLERVGVNATSDLPRDPDVYRREAALLPPQRAILVGKITPAAVRNIGLFHLMQYAFAPIFSGYSPPYPYTPLQQLTGHARRYVSARFQKARRARQLLQVLDATGPIFLALLQRPGDSQLTRHSRFSSVAAFIDEVVRSFAIHAPDDARLLFKIHPLDHGLENHAATVHSAAKAAGMAGRVICIDGGHLPTLIRASSGVLSVNSTGGLTAIEYGRPALTLGRAIYDLPGLTHQSGLDRFWTAPEAPDLSLYKAFRRVVMKRTQINGAFSTAKGIDIAVHEAARRLLEA